MDLELVKYAPVNINTFSELENEKVMADLGTCIEDGTVAAIGECGLEYHRLHFCEKEQHKEGLISQLQLQFTNIFS